VDLILAEDTRNSLRLMQHFSIKTHMVACHEHNEKVSVEKWLAQLKSGASLALISDAGTPLISDPGYQLVSAARQAGIRVCPVPGACSIIAALSASGLASDRFVFEGFLPAKKQARQNRLQVLKKESRTLLFLEAPHRVLESVRDMQQVLGGERHAVIARELTKTFESIHMELLDDLPHWLEQDEYRTRGEIVLLIEGATEVEDDSSAPVLEVLLNYLPLSQAVAATCKITGGKRNQVYSLATSMQAAKSS
jgi:16S rRNA (cytidine1402-2'-O)-methyltransferase